MPLAAPPRCSSRDTRDATTARARAPRRRAGTAGDRRSSGPDRRRPCSGRTRSRAARAPQHVRRRIEHTGSELAADAPCMRVGGSEERRERLARTRRRTERACQRTVPAGRRPFGRRRPRVEIDLGEAAREEPIRSNQSHMAAVEQQAPCGAAAPSLPRPPGRQKRVSDAPQGVTRRTHAFGAGVTTVRRAVVTQDDVGRHGQAEQTCQRKRAHVAHGADRPDAGPSAAVPESPSRQRGSQWLWLPRSLRRRASRSSRNASETRWPASPGITVCVADRCREEHERQLRS